MAQYHPREDAIHTEILVPKQIAQNRIIWTPILEAICSDWGITGIDDDDGYVYNKQNDLVITWSAYSICFLLKGVIEIYFLHILTDQHSSLRTHICNHSTYLLFEQNLVKYFVHPEGGFLITILKLRTFVAIEKLHVRNRFLMEGHKICYLCIYLFI